MGGGDRPAGHFRTHGARFDHDHLDAERGDFASHTKSGLPADAAAKVIDKAVTARKPRTRYTIGRDAALLTRLARILPDRTLDRVFAAALRPHFPKQSK